MKRPELTLEICIFIPRSSTYGHLPFPISQFNHVIEFELKVSLGKYPILSCMRKQKLRGELVWVPGVVPCKEQSSEASYLVTDACASLTRAWVNRSKGMQSLWAVVRRVHFPINCLTNPLLEMWKYLPIPNPHRPLPPLPLWLLRKFGQGAEHAISCLTPLLSPEREGERTHQKSEWATETHSSSPPYLP